MSIILCKIEHQCPGVAIQMLTYSHSYLFVTFELLDIVLKNHDRLLEEAFLYLYCYAPAFLRNITYLSYILQLS